MQNDLELHVPPSGGSLEIGNNPHSWVAPSVMLGVPPSGGSLEIGNSRVGGKSAVEGLSKVPPSGGSLEIGNCSGRLARRIIAFGAFPLRGDP